MAEATSRAVGQLDVAGKLVLVTGGGQGRLSPHDCCINFEFVKLAYNAGAKIIIADLHLSAEAESLVGTSGGDVCFQKTDVVDWKQLEYLLHVSLIHFNDVPDVYVAGAGVFEPKWSNFWDDQETERYAEIDINVSHVIKLTRIAMRALVSREKKGVVLSTSSVAGLVGFYTSPLYCASKHAIVGFTKSMALADAYEGVKIVTICPGAVDTTLWDEEKRLQFTTRKNTDLLNAKDVGRLMLDMVQDEKYVGGSVVEIGGLEGAVRVRVIPQWNVDPPPPGGLQKLMATDPEARKLIYEPITRKMGEERGQNWPSIGVESSNISPHHGSGVQGGFPGGFF